MKFLKMMRPNVKKYITKNNKHWNTGNKGRLKHTENQKLIDLSLKKFYINNVIWNKDKNCPQISMR